jgi:hypothetical protein
MPLFLEAQTIEAAIEGLANSGVAPTLTDYLVFKRAYVISRNAANEQGDPPPGTVTTGTTTSAFVAAINQMAGTTFGHPGSTWDGQPFFSPFGAARDTGRGFKSRKYPSNGPSDTVGGWQSRPGRPLQIAEGTSPKQYAFVSRSREELADYFRAKSSTQPLPSLLDLAIWWHRFADLDEVFGHEPTEGELVEATVRDFGLTEVEIEALFSAPLPEQSDDDAAL